MKLYTFSLPHSTGGPLEGLVKKQLPEISGALIHEAFRRRDVKLNGTRVSLGAEAVSAGFVQIYLPDHAENEIPILYEDDRVLAVHKPAGISCVPDGHGAVPLPLILARQMKKSDPDVPTPIVCHRLDNQTEGLLLLAKDEEAAFLLEDAFRRHQLQKRYECLVKGCPAQKHRVLEGWLMKDASASRVRIVPSERSGAKWIQTEYSVLEEGGISRLLVTLHTGRTHQIRAHLSYVGLPLLGDDQYGDRDFNREQHRKKLALCAVELTCSPDIALEALRGRTLSTRPHF